MILDRILIPLDGSPESEGILGDLRRFFRRKDSEILLLRVISLPSVESQVLTRESAASEALDYLKPLSQRLLDSGLRVRALVRSGPVAESIVDVASEEKATLIAMTTHGRTGFARAVLGSVAETVLRRSPVPVLGLRVPGQTAPPAGAAERPLATILVPLDGSDRARVALGPAADLALLTGARVLVLHALEADETAATEAARAILQKAVDSLRRQGIDASDLTDLGNPADAILAATRFHEVDLVVMATHGRSGLARLVSGSVAERILRESRVPVLLVRSVEVPALERGVRSPSP